MNISITINDDVYNNIQYLIDNNLNNIDKNINTVEDFISNNINNKFVYYNNIVENHKKEVIINIVNKKPEIKRLIDSEVLLLKKSK